jgi:Paraquat-inducible protein A
MLESAPMPTAGHNRVIVAVLLVASMVLLLPGLFLPVLTIRGVLTRDGLAKMAPQMLENGLDDDTVKTLTAMMNPTVVAMAQSLGGDIRKMIIERLKPQITAALQSRMSEVEVYQQTRSIVGAVRNLYNVGSPLPATLILLFSVIVPLTKAALVAWAAFLASPEHRTRTLRFVVAIAKWSMADVFVVALFITYLAAQATQTPPGDPSAAPLVVFTARLGAGFYWFAAYCLFSLASQQYTTRVVESAGSLSVPAGQSANRI